MKIVLLKDGRTVTHDKYNTCYPVDTDGPRLYPNKKARAIARAFSGKAITISEWSEVQNGKTKS